MTKKNCTREMADIKALISEDQDLLKGMLKKLVHEVLEAEMTEHLGVGAHERSPGRQGYRAGYYQRELITRVGTLELRVPRDREGNFSSSLFERYQRSEKALVTALQEMYIQGVSTRKVKKITEELCGHEFSASAVSEINKKLDTQLQTFATRPLTEAYPYVILDARYEKVREGGIVRTQAVLVALGINWEGRREVLGIELANRESATSWKEFLVGLKKRGLHGVELVMSDQHAGLKRSIMEVIPEALWQRCYVHFLRNALDYLPRKGHEECLQELRWLYQRKDIEEAQRDLRLWLKRWESKYPRLCSWVEENIHETLTFYRMPIEHHKHLRSTNMLERVNEEIKRRTRVVRIFPNQASALRLILSLGVEFHDDWLEDKAYLKMEYLKEQKKERKAIEAVA